VFDHCGWAVVVCVAGDEIIDRRRIELVEPGLPWLPHHSEGQRLPLDEAVALVERVRASAEQCAKRGLAELPASVGAISIRGRPKMPATITERLMSYWAQTRADGVMYRDVIAEAAEARGWSVREYETKTVFSDAADALALDDISGRLKEIGETVGRPWDKDHRLATAAAIVAAKASRPPT
jgi:hypothetical protein